MASGSETRTEQAWFYENARCLCCVNVCRMNVRDKRIFRTFSGRLQAFVSGIDRKCCVFHVLAQTSQGADMWPNNHRLGSASRNWHHLGRADDRSISRDAAHEHFADHADLQFCRRCAVYVLRKAFGCVFRAWQRSEKCAKNGLTMEGLLRYLEAAPQN